VRAEPLVGGRHQEITSDGLHVDRHVRGGLDRIHKADRTGGTRLAADGGDIIDGAGAVGRVAYRHDLRFAAQHLVERVIGKFKRLGVEVEPLDGGTGVRCHVHPRCHVGVMVHPGQHDFVAFRNAQRLLQVARHGQRHGGHVGAEHDVRRRRRIVELCRRNARMVDQFLCLLRGDEIAAQIGVLLDHRLCGAVNHLLWNLRAGRVVKVDPRVSIIGQREGWKLGADAVNGEAAHAEKTLAEGEVVTCGTLNLYLSHYTAQPLIASR
jgi:hypothetical protein